MQQLHLIIFLALAILTKTGSSCNNPSCFRKKLFDFSYPSQDIYNINLGFDSSMMNNMIRAYGDFNNDLRADYVSIDSNTNNTLIFLYNTQSGVYELTATITPYLACNPLNYYLYDSDGDSDLDIAVWGQSNQNNCLYPIMQGNNGFIQNTTDPVIFNVTTQPILFQYNLAVAGGYVKTNCLLIFNSDSGINQRQILYLSGNSYTTLGWSQLFTSQTVYSNIAFSDQHWNTYTDLTTDCYSDIIITNNQNELEFWIFSIAINKFQLTVMKKIQFLITSFSIIDVNYDGGLDIVMSDSSQIYIYLNLNGLSTSSTFCNYGSMTFAFSQSPLLVPIPAGNTLPQQNFMFADLNINGYPEMMILLANLQNNNRSIAIFENVFQTGGIFSVYDRYQNAVNDLILSQKLNVISTSFFDILDNGIVDIIVTLEGLNGVFSNALYNNYLYQNSYFFKAYATNGKAATAGTQVSGVSFYWANSVGNEEKVAYLSQISQTAYFAYPMPYVLSGLGRANNYVEMFTIGRMGDYKSWSPIIPNSQLAIFSGSESSNWIIKIFILPADSIVYVVIVCIVILALLGVILMVLKCRSKKIIEPLLQDL